MTMRARAMFLTALLALGAAAGVCVNATPAAAGAARNHIARATQSHRDAVATQARLQTRIADLLTTEQGLESKINDAARRVLQALANEQAAFQRLDFAQQALADRARIAYEVGPGAGLEAFLNAGSLSELGAASEYAARTIGADAQTVKQLTADQAALTAQRIQAEQQQQTLAAEETQVTILLDQAQTALDQATVAAQQTGAHLQALQQQQQAIQRARDRQQARQTQVIQAVANLSASSRGEWAQVFLSQEGYPACQSNLVALVAWETQEGTSARWNPLATTLPMSGATNFNSVGVKNYVSLAQGIQATEQTLQNGATTYGYGAILAALQRCAPAAVTAQAINASSWCAGCTNGMYVTGLIRRVDQNYSYYAAL